MRTEKRDETTYENIHEAMADGVGGFSFKGQSITDPFTDESGFGPVDPVEHYGFALRDSGGGHTQWYKEDEDGYIVLLTDRHGERPPQCSHEWMLGVYPDADCMYSGEPLLMIDVDPHNGVSVTDYRVYPSREERRRPLYVNGTRTTVGDFLHANVDGFSDAAIIKVLKMQPGDYFRFGGGAFAEGKAYRPRDLSDNGAEPGSIDAKTAYRRLSEAAIKLEEAADLLGRSGTYTSIMEDI